MFVSEHKMCTKLQITTNKPQLQGLCPQHNLPEIMIYSTSSSYEPNIIINIMINLPVSPERKVLIISSEIANACFESGF